MVNTGLLILTNPAKVKKILPTVNKHVLQTLYIQYFPEGHIIPVTETPVTNPQWKWPRYAQTVANIYTTTTVISPRLDVRVLLTSLKNPSVCIVNTKKPVEMVIFDQNYSQAQADTFIQDYLANASMDCKFIVCNGEKNQESQNESCRLQETKPYRNVVLGGTFDRLHNGHKIFLSEAVGRCTEKLTVGVTDTNMLTGKLLWELIESCPKRSMGVKDFLEDVEPHLIYNIVPINDMYGPTKDDPTFEMIVVSEETKKGADKINEVRMHNKLNQLDVHVVNLVVDETHREYEESKISSSNQRIRLLGSRLKVPNIGHKPLKPYIIGLTGGIASGKSSVAQKLEALGAGHVNCDKLAHDSYLPGNRCYKLIIEHFGSDILTDDGFIDRKALGDKVFQNKEELKKLNELLWPVILEDAKKEIGVLYEKGFDVIILEAAVLIQANWMHECHEIWTCIVPEKEAVNRLRERNALSEKEAKSRIQAQPSNLEQVEKANVVFCTLWSHEVTQNQVQKAWDELSAFMSQYKHS